LGFSSKTGDTRKGNVYKLGSCQAVHVFLTGNGDMCRMGCVKRARKDRLPAML